ncbi:MAG: NAD(P)H-hydrate epimerase, partial [Pseudomonadota bacterium]|nr:NAD(P)H-hydrate epimerase [Pseudomonadota bacterium]
MIAIEGQPILTAAQMSAVEARAFADGSSVDALMERAGTGVAAAVRRLASGAPVLVLCGPGNNGGDGYVAARILRGNGLAVRVAATGDPTSEAAMAARTAWGGAVDAIGGAESEPVVVDALFGTGLSRPLTPPLADALAQVIGEARLAIAVDLPSGVNTDTGAILGASRGYGLTLALGALKPAHVLEPAAGLAREVRLIELGLDPASDATAMPRPILPRPTARSHKYTRGMVAIIGGAMPGAAALAAEAAERAGAGYVLLLAEEMPQTLPHAIVRKPWAEDALADHRIGAVLIGPGLGRDARA